MFSIDKLLMRFSINQRMIVNFVVTLAGLAGLLALLFSKSVQMSDVAAKSRLSEELNSGMLMLRRNEKDFLSRLNLNYAEQLNSSYTKLNNTIEQYRQYSDNLSKIDLFAQHIQDYHKGFNALVDIQKRIGLHPEDGYYGELRAAVHDIEDSVKAESDYKILSYILQLRRREKDFMLRLESEYVDKFNRDIVDLKNALVQSDISAEAKRKIERNLLVYQDKFSAFVKGMVEKGLDAKSGKLGELREAVHRTESLLADITTENEVSIQAFIANSRLTAVSLAVGLIFLVGVFVYFNGRSIVRPITQVSSWISKVRNDDDLTLTMEAQGEDEIAEMVRHLNSLVGDFRQLVGDVDKTLSTLDSAVKGLTQTVESTRNEMNHQLSETDMVATAVTQMRATIDEIAQNTELAASKSNEANSNAKEGQQEVMLTSSSIRKLSEQLAEAGNSVQQLALDANNIGSVLDVIRNIAEQTNLLALNAAIEAARAGEQGRGFAVVADEVRNLAMRTQESTREIEQIIQTLQSRTSSVVEQMQQCREQGNTSSSQANKTGNLLAQITSDVTMISDMSLQVATAIEEQSKVASEVNENLVRIRDISDQSVQNTQSLVNVTENVSEQAAILGRAVRIFKI